MALRFARRVAVPSRSFVRIGLVVAAYAAVVFSAGCPSMIRHSAADAIAAEIRPRDSPLVNQLETSGNPKGEGVIVFVRSRGQCAPRYSWIWLNETVQSYAVDKASQEITPGLPILDDASETTLKLAGSKGDALAAAIQGMLCHSDDSSR